MNQRSPQSTSGKSKLCLAALRSSLWLHGWPDRIKKHWSNNKLHVEQLVYHRLNAILRCVCCSCRIQMPPWHSLLLCCNSTTHIRWCLTGGVQALVNPVTISIQTVLPQLPGAQGQVWTTSSTVCLRGCSVTDLLLVREQEAPLTGLCVHPFKCKMHLSALWAISARRVSRHLLVCYLVKGGSQLSVSLCRSHPWY